MHNTVRITFSLALAVGLLTIDTINVSLIGGSSVPKSPTTTSGNPSSTSGSTAPSPPGAPSPPDFAGYGAVIAGLAAVGTVMWGIYQYGKGQITNRQQVLFAHIKEMNDSKELTLAKQLIEYKKVRNPIGGWFSPKYYYLKDLEFLKDPTKGLDDPGKLEIKDSLDSFIVFLGKIGYSLDVGAIERAEIIYFQYWIHKTLDKEAVQDYINLPQNQFPLYQTLLRELAESRIDGFLSRLAKWMSYQKNWAKPITPKERDDLRRRLAPPLILHNGQRKILSTVDEKSGHAVSKPVISTDIVKASGLPASEANRYLSQLEEIGLIKTTTTTINNNNNKVSGADYRMVNMTEEGLNETSKCRGNRG